ncbi:MAG: tRNA (guanosine(46)-N7)-methyltransferase TrmB [Alphaproteobacteria bacterium]|nr:tRNA (guanosine(46)-N7)-methyltransferase TrmB [Alphaproteobacteria bacterium]
MVHGRRGGTRLRAGRRRLLETLLPRLHFTLPDQGELSAPLFLFPETARGALWLEIGFGAGEHLAAQAAAHPDVGIIGCEPYRNGIASLLADIETQDLENIRIFTDHAADLVTRLPTESLTRVFLLFPDPWPKQRHHKRRIVQAAFLDDLARAMADGGELRVATDHNGYCQWIMAHLLAHPSFAWCAVGWRGRPDDWPPTRYEAKALLVGSRCVYLRFCRRPRSRQP